MAAQQTNDRLQGTLDLLVLKTLASGPMHGWSVALRIQDVSRDALQINQGSLYPALHRLEDAGYVDAEWGLSENNRRAKFYRLTARGRRQLEIESESWRKFTEAVALVLRLA
jgi:transcriptional regulator